MSDQDRISPHDIDTISSILVMRIKKNIDKGIQYQILKTDIIRTVWKTVRRDFGSERVKNFKTFLLSTPNLHNSLIYKKYM